jgi:hypothetical protein
MNKIKNINWGEDDAKSDPALEDFFFETPDYQKLLLGKKYLIIGRKGTGKTALLEKIRIDSSKKHDCFYSDISLAEFPVNALRELRDRSMQNKAQFIPIWTFSILVELANKIIYSEEGSLDESKIELKQFLKRNFPNAFGGIVASIKVLNERHSKVFVGNDYVGGFGNHSTQTSEQIVPVHYLKYIEKLKSLIFDIKTTSTYYFLFDYLDEGYDPKSDNTLLILALMKSISNLLKDFKQFSTITFRPILALRSDIFDRLNDNDLNKYDDYIIRLNWSTDERDLYSLKQLINKRINASLNNSSKIDSWNIIVDEVGNYRPEYPESTLWNRVANNTFERPRDVIKFMKITSEILPENSHQIKKSDISAAEKDYSDWFYKEIRDEIYPHLKIWEIAFNKHIAADGHIIQTKNTILEKFNNDPAIKEYLAINHLTGDDILSILFDFCFIGCRNGAGRWIFKYKDSNFSWNSGTQEIQIHRGFVKKFALRYEGKKGGR